MIHFERKNRKKRNPVLGCAIMLVCFSLLTILCVVRRVSTDVTLLSAAMVGISIFFLIREKRNAQ